MITLLTALPWLLLILIAGLFGLLILFKWDMRRLVRSSLFVKSLVWIPLFTVFFVASLSWISALIVAVVTAGLGIREWLRKDIGRQHKVYILLFVIGCAAWPLSVGVCVPNEWMAIVGAAVLSDVGAFFAGNFAGRHKLPDALNSHKSYEGVAGQLVGGIIGAVIMGAIFQVPMAWEWGLAIGVLCAIGDLGNSFVKRQLDIKDWGATIPAHGGVIDRFSSLNVVLIGTALWLSFGYLV